jgi:hypothetical protein
MAFSTTWIITDMREGWGLTMFRRSIHKCPVVPDRDTMFNKHSPNCTNIKNVHLLCIHVPFWPSTIIISKINKHEHKYITFIKHTYFQQRQNGGSVPTKTLRKSFRLSMTFTIIRLTTGRSRYWVNVTRMFHSFITRLLFMRTRNS